MSAAGDSLAEKCALVTGGGSGIGRAIAAALAAEGCRVAVSGRRNEPLQETVSEIEVAGGRAVAVVADVTSPASMSQLVGEVVAQLGDLHMLVNNAGVARSGPVESYSEEEIDHLLDVDLKGPLHAIRAALPRLRCHRQERCASILNVSSNVTLLPLNNYSVYSAAKAGLDMLTRCLALELADDRIRVNAVSPGVVDTPIFDTMMPSAAARELLAGFHSAVPLGRVGRPDDIARAAVMLCDPQNDWITGVILPVDGGLSLGSP